MAAHQVDQCIQHDLHHEFARLDGFEDIPLPEGFILDLVCKLLRNFVVDISTYQCPPDLLDGLGDVEFSEPPLPFDILEGQLHFFI